MFCIKLNSAVFPTSSSYGGKWNQCVSVLNLHYAEMVVRSEIVWKSMRWKAYFSPYVLFPLPPETLKIWVSIASFSCSWIQQKYSPINKNWEQSRVCIRVWLLFFFSCFRRKTLTLACFQVLKVHILVAQTISLAFSYTCLNRFVQILVLEANAKMPNSRLKNCSAWWLCLHFFGCWPPDECW